MMRRVVADTYTDRISAGISRTFTFTSLLSLPLNNLRIRYTPWSVLQDGSDGWSTVYTEVQSLPTQQTQPQPHFDNKPSDNVTDKHRCSHSCADAP